MKASRPSSPAWKARGPWFFGIFTLLTLLFATGAIWGLGIAALTGAAWKPAVKTSAKNWGIGYFLAALSLEVVMVPLILLSRNSFLNLHLLFTLAFVAATALVSARVSSRMSAAVGFEAAANKIGKKTGWAAGLGFLAASLALQFGLGWEVGHPVFQQYNMLTITHICNAVAGLAGGATLGWLLGQHDPVGAEPVAASY